MNKKPIINWFTDEKENGDLVYISEDIDGHSDLSYLIIDEYSEKKETKISCSLEIEKSPDNETIILGVGYESVSLAIMDCIKDLNGRL